MKWNDKAVSTAIIAALIVAQALFVASYIGSEHTIYYWDHAMYIGMARQAFAAFGHSFAEGWADFRQSLSGNYNLIFTLPSLIGFGLFGEDRAVFILANYFAFFLTYEIAAAYLLRVGLKCGWKQALILSLVSSSLIPPLWLPLLEGYPDSGAAACLVFAAALSFDQSWRRPWFVRALIVGAVLGFAVLLRRHFVYPAIAELVALFVIGFWDIRDKKYLRRALVPLFAYFALCGIGFVGIIALIAPDFLLNALTINYGALYVSYARPAWVFLYFLLGGFGYGLLLAAASGMILLARFNENGKRLAAFAALFGFLWLVIWCAGPDQMGHHYMLHVLPLMTSVGLTGWFFYLSKKPDRKKYLIGGALAVFLAANSAWALWFSPTGVWPNDNGVPGLLSAARPPVVRDDYDEWLRLADYLYRTTRPDDRIMMVGSSFIFNQDLLRSIYTDILDDPDAFSRFVRSGEIDHEEPAPLNPFAAANIYLVPAPAQYHLDPAGQRVITAAANQFPPPASRSAMFRKDDAVFHLADGVIVNIWRRDAWTPDRLHAALAEIRRDGPQDANFMQDWVTEMMPLQAQIFTNRDNRTFVTGLFDPAHKDIRLFFDYPLGSGKQRVIFSLAGNCPAPALNLAIVSGQGRKETEKGFSPETGSIETARSFEVSAASGEPRFLELGLTVSPAALCRVEIRDLRVEMQP